MGVKVAIAAPHGRAGTCEPWEELFARRTRAGVGAEIAEIIAQSSAPGVISFSGGFPDPSTFPAAALGDLLDKVSRDPAAVQYAPSGGLPGTREWLRDRLGHLEGRRPEESELIVTSGGIEGLQLVSRSLLDPGDLVVVEAPSYLGAIMAFRGFEAEVAGVPLDDEGMDVGALARLLAARRPKLVYTIPDFQNPAGVSMATGRRAELVELARRHGVLVVEDVAYRELGFGGARRPSLWALGPEVTVQLGTFSKTFTPGFRMGWAAGPPAVVAQLLVAKQTSDQCTGAFGQRLLEELGRSGQLDRSVEVARRLYAGRWGRLRPALERFLPEAASFSRPGGGFFTWVTVPGRDTSALAGAALANGVAYVPGAHFYADGRGGDQLRLSFSNLADDETELGAKRLGEVLAGTGEAAGTTVH